MEKMMHLAAQYLAAVGISFLDKKEDDSHTNLGFSTEEGIMFSRPLGNSGEILALDYNDFTLKWITKTSSTSFKLNGHKHSEVLKWIEKMADTSGIGKPYSYKFHYDINYEITPDFTFQLTDPARLSELKQLRTTAHASLKSFLVQRELSSEIRTWPHHFDTGAFVALDAKPNISIGLGLAVPDSVCAEHYFYVSGYHGHTAIDTSNYGSLENGTWRNNGFKGAVLAATDVDQITAFAFFNQTLAAYIR